MVVQALRVSVFQCVCQRPFRSVARSAVTTSDPASLQCMPGPFNRRPTSCLAVDSIIPPDLPAVCAVRRIRRTIQTRLNVIDQLIDSRFFLRQQVRSVNSQFRSPQSP